jgi:TonB family protein
MIFKSSIYGDGNMTRTEWRNYKIALVLSIVLHLIILLAYFPAHPFPRNIFLETIPVGMVEIPAGSSLSGPPAAEIASNPGSDDSPPVLPDTGATVLKSNQPEPKEKDSLKVKPTSTPKVTQTSKPASDVKPGQKPGIQDGTPGSGETGTGGGNGGTRNGPTGFGTGEGQVLRLGRMPAYPKGAMNEGKEGDVGVRLLVGAGGALEKIELIQPSVDERFDKAVIYVIQNDWQFKPESQNYYIDLVFSFSIKNGVCSVKFIHSETRP